MMENTAGSQERFFLASEGDAWFRRNAKVLGTPSSLHTDPCIRLASRLPSWPQSVVEIGCANGWRLAEFARRGSALCVGVDVSETALRDGLARARADAACAKVFLVRGRASALPIKAPLVPVSLHSRRLGNATLATPNRFQGAPSEGGSRHSGFRLAILSFVLHWIDREALLRVAAEVDALVEDGGYLIVSDFLPDRPTKVPYHHAKGAEIFTYKQDYAALFEATCLYKRVRGLVFDHDEPSKAFEVSGKLSDLAIDKEGPLASAFAEIGESARAAAWVLEKSSGDLYVPSVIGTSSDAADPDPRRDTSEEPRIEAPQS
jgi:SAM-dependent methyltransferase